MGAEYAEDLPYWKTGKSAPETWIEKARIEIERAAGSVLAEGFGRDQGSSAYLMRFEMQGDSFRIVWPVLDSKWEGNESDRTFLNCARRQE